MAAAPQQVNYPPIPQCAALAGVDVAPVQPQTPPTEQDVNDAYMYLRRVENSRPPAANLAAADAYHTQVINQYGT